METNSMNLFDRASQWFQQSLTIKIFSIGFLVLILIIPTSLVTNVMEERENRATDVVNEVSEKWSGPQTLAGPILVIPYTYQEKITTDKGVTEMFNKKGKAYFLPENINITGNVNPQTLHRGIFDAVVYESSLQVQSEFADPDFSSWNIPDESIAWKDAYFVYGISDLRGITENSIKLGEREINAEPTNNVGVTFASATSAQQLYAREGDNNQSVIISTGMVIPIGATAKDDIKQKLNLSIKFKGSVNLFFSPVGKTTSVHLESPWPDPSFDGEFLPQPRTVSDSGFVADWKILHLNRPFDPKWITENKFLGNSNFGVKLLVPVEQYQMSIRTAKYSELIIFLTFIALLLVEISQKIKIHPFQYILIGMALIVYYTLLLSFAEQFGYDFAYWIAALSTAGLITIYSTTFFKRKLLSWLLLAQLLVFYTFIYVIVIQQDFSLLIGSVGLFIVTALLMYFSRKIKWYNE